jgi:hypothetical protein
MNKDTRLMAFWENDRFPHLLYGEVLDVLEGGFMQIDGYAWHFRPRIIVPYEEGKQLAEKLEALTSEYRGEVQNLKNRYIDIVNSLLKQHGNYQVKK